jgi:hypothetical protein
MHKENYYVIILGEKTLDANLVEIGWVNYGRSIKWENYKHKIQSDMEWD